MPITLFVSSESVIVEQSGPFTASELRSKISDLAHLGDALIERIRTAVATWDRAPLLVMLFGSAATGQMRVDSDIDVFVVGNEPRKAGDRTLLRRSRRQAG